MSGLGSNTAAKEAVRVGFDYFKGNLNRISASAKFSDHEYHLHVVELHNTGPSTKSLAALIAFCSILMNRPIQEQMVVLGEMTLGGVINPVQDLAGSLQLAMDSGASVFCSQWPQPQIFQRFLLSCSQNSRSAFMQIPSMPCLRRLGLID